MGVPELRHLVAVHKCECGVVLVVLLLPEAACLDALPADAVCSEVVVSACVPAVLDVSCETVGDACRVTVATNLPGVMLVSSVDGRSVELDGRRGAGRPTWCVLAGQ